MSVSWIRLWHATAPSAALSGQSIPAVLAPSETVSLAPDDAQAHDLQGGAVGPVQAQADQARHQLQLRHRVVHGQVANAEQARHHLGHGHAVRSHRGLHPSHSHATPICSAYLLGQGNHHAIQGKVHSSALQSSILGSQSTMVAS